VRGGTRACRHYSFPEKQGVPGPERIAACCASRLRLIHEASRNASATPAFSAFTHFADVTTGKFTVPRAYFLFWVLEIFSGRGFVAACFVPDSRTKR